MGIDWKELTTVNRGMIIVKIGYFLHGLGIKNTYLVYTYYTILTNIAASSMVTPYQNLQGRSMGLGFDDLSFVTIITRSLSFFVVPLFGIAKDCVVQLA